MTPRGRGTSIDSLKRAAIPCLLFAASTAAFAQAAPNVTEPQGINLGVTSFFDGFSGPPGFSYLGVLRYTSGTSVKDNSGNDVFAFRSPRVDTFSMLHHLSYTSPLHFLGGTLGFNAILPVIWLRGKTDQPGASLVGNGTALGDLTFGPQLQMAPIIGDGGRPVFVQRFEVDVIAPTGQYKHNADLNQSSGYFSLNPYWQRSTSRIEWPLPGVEPTPECPSDGAGAWRFMAGSRQCHQRFARRKAVVEQGPRRPRA
ncbi:SphA family protein [Paraburkholderia caribensis]|uniref:SphA family protein n=1 Tax=Paraburkholderia caribensis TaxID=75105 RepID=UPI0031D4C985